LNFALQQGKKRKNNGFILSIFNAAAGQKALYRATYPYAVLPKGALRMEYLVLLAVILTLKLGFIIVIKKK
jgi:hypothetical protein